MAMNVTVPASAVFFHYVIIESINVLLVLVEFIKLIICHIIFNGNNFCLGDYVTYSCPVDDLSNWRYEGIIYGEFKKYISK